jgi:uncharacterized protein YbjT (DUF2867 family)
MLETILVAGATGGVGRSVLRKLLERGLTVRGLVRDTSKTRPIFNVNVDFMIADVRDKDSLREAMQGGGKLICAIGAKPPLKADNGPEQVDYEGVRNLVEVAKIVGIDHFVLVSCLGVTQSEHPFNQTFNNVLTWKLRGEDVLRASGIPYTIVRPGGLTDDLGMAGIEFSQGDQISGRISREDVAEVCVQALEQPAARNVTFEIAASSEQPPTDWAAVFTGLVKNSA